jgi:biopolymer transport protein ExbD
MRIGKPKLEFCEIDWTPMIDMTFQLIAFFMIALNFSEADQNEKIHLPLSELAKPPDTPLEYPIVVHLQKSGRVIFGAEEIPVEALRTYMGREVTFLRLKEKTPADATVIVRGDASAQTGDVQKVIQICQELGFERYALRAQEEVR